MINWTRRNRNITLLGPLMGVVYTAPVNFHYPAPLAPVKANWSASPGIVWTSNENIHVGRGLGFPLKASSATPAVVGEWENIQDTK